MVLILKRGASKKEIESIEKKLKNREGIDVMKYCGKVKLKEDALKIQKNLRNEWK
jgi:cytidylate kinase